MADLIRREDVFKGLWAKHTHHGMGLDALITMEDALDAVVSIPAVDAVEVRHGRWIAERLASTYGGAYQIFLCSECKSAFNCEMKYCAHCGAKMDGEGHE